MVTINGEVNIILSIFCMGFALVLLISPVIIAAIIGTRARLRETKQIQRNLVDGVYSKWDKTKTTRFRMMMLCQTILLLGSFIWMITGFMNIAEMFSLFRLIALGFIFVTMFVLGILTNRMIVRGK